MPDILMNMGSEHEMKQRKLSDVFRRTYGITSEGEITPFPWTGGARTRSRPSDAMKVDG